MSTNHSTISPTGQIFLDLLPDAASGWTEAIRGSRAQFEQVRLRYEAEDSQLDAQRRAANDPLSQQPDVSGSLVHQGHAYEEEFAFIN